MTLFPAFLTLVALLAARSTRIATVTVNPTSSVSGQEIHLADVARITGGAATLSGSLRALDLGVAPLPGQMRILLRGDIIVMLRAAHIDDRRLVLECPQQFEVQRTYTSVQANEVVQAALAAARPAIANLAGASLEAEGVQSPGDLPSGKVSLAAAPPLGRPEQGTLIVPVSISVGGRAIRTISVVLHVRRRLSTVIAGHWLPPGQVLKAEDLSMAVVDLPPGMEQPVLQLSEAVGKRTLRQIGLGQPLDHTMLETPPDVVSNAQITIRCTFGSVSISAPGVAQQAGRVGDVIRVYSPETHKEVSGQIVDAHTVSLIEQP